MYTGISKYGWFTLLAWAVSCLLVYKVLGNAAAANKQSNEMANAFLLIAVRLIIRQI